MSGEHHFRYVPESSAVSRAFVGWSALGALVLLGISIGGFYGIYRATAPTGTMPAPQTFSQPRVDTHESEDLHHLLDAQNNRLEAWGWADDQHTLVQIPIERAMQLLAKKGSGAYAPLLPPEALSAPTAAAERAMLQREKTQGAASVTPNPRQEMEK